VAGSTPSDRQYTVKPRSSLSVRLSLIFSAVVLVILATLASVFFFAILAFVRPQIRQSQLVVAKNNMTAIDRFLYERQNDVAKLSLLDQAVGYTAKPTPATAATLAKAAGTLLNTGATNWRDVSVFDTEGRQLINLIGSSDLASYARSPLSAPLLQDAQTQTVQSDVLPASLVGAPGLVFATPIKNHGQTIGVLVGLLDWQKVLSIVSSANDSHLVLLDDQDRIIGDNRQDAISRILQTNYIAHPTQEIAATYTEAGYLDYRGQDWRLVASMPQAAANSEAWGLTWPLALSMTAGAVLAIVAMAYIIRRQVVAPIQVLSAAVGRISLGDLSQVAETKSYGELAVLAQNFNFMTEQLSRSYQQLEATTRVAQESHVQLQSSINSLHQGFILTDPKGKILLANPAATELVFGSKADEADTKGHANKHITLEQLAVTLPSDFALSARISESLKDHKQIKFASLPLQDKFLNLYISPVLHAGRAIGGVVLLEDVTEEHILQRSRDEFFSIASHELRTPLTAIKGNAAMIMDQFAAALKDTDLREMVEDIHTSSNRLIEIVNDFLDTSRLEQGKTVFNLQPFQVSSVIEQVAYEMKTVLKQKKLKLQLSHSILTQDALPLVYADPDRTKQIVYNLVGNAVKFTSKGSIAISAEPSAGFITVKVRDTGSGIPGQTQNLLFRKFQQAGTNILTRDSTRGTGLGLYICKLLAKQMGGHIGLESSSPQGTTFFFTLPIAKSNDSKTAK